MKLRPLVLLFLLLSVTGLWGQVAGNDFFDSLGLARLKNYSTARVSSGNSYVLSNDDSKRIMPGETLVLADLSGPGMITHIWLGCPERICMAKAVAPARVL